MSEQAALDFDVEVDAFMLPSKRNGVQWRIVRDSAGSRRTNLWHVAMLVNGREVLWSSIDYRPEPGDQYLKDSERNYFHD